MQFGLDIVYFSNIDLNKTSSGINNFTYLVESESYQEDFLKFRELTNYDTLGIIIEDHMMDLLPLADTFDKAFVTSLRFIATWP